MQLGGNRCWVPLTCNRSWGCFLVINQFHYKQCGTLRVLRRGQFIDGMGAA